MKNSKRFTRSLETMRHTPMLLLCGAAITAYAADLTQAGEQARLDAQSATSVIVYQRDARGALSGVGEIVTHGEPVHFSHQFSYLVATNGPHDAYDGHWSLTISNLRYGANGDTAFDVNMEGKDPGVWAGEVTTHVLIDQGSHSGIVRGIDGKDYLIELHRVDG